MGVSRESEGVMRRRNGTRASVRSGDRVGWRRCQRTTREQCGAVPRSSPERHPEERVGGRANEECHPEERSDEGSSLPSSTRASRDVHYNAANVYHIYILASDSRRLYVGMTSDLVRRVWQHRVGALPGFTQRYRISRLVYFESTTDARAAVARERQVKAWTREKRLRLVESVNAGWTDLATTWFVDPMSAGGRAP